jgi:hypothetical protein
MGVRIWRIRREIIGCGGLLLMSILATEGAGEFWEVAGWLGASPEAEAYGAVGVEGSLWCVLVVGEVGVVGFGGHGCAWGSHFVVHATGCGGDHTLATFDYWLLHRDGSVDAVKFVI